MTDKLNVVGDEELFTNVDTEKGEIELNEKDKKLPCRHHQGIDQMMLNNDYR